MQQENQKAIDNALFKKLEEISIKMPSDPILYKEDVQKYTEFFKVEFQKIQGDTMKKNQRFGQLLIFLAKSVRFFPTQLGFIPTTTMSLMNELGKSLHHYIRKKCISAIMILRAKNILYPISTIEFLLKQFNIEDKQLRKILYKYIVNDIRRMNRHHKNNQINQELKKFISQYITKYSDKTAQKSLQIMIDLYKKNIWNDNRTVNIIADGCFNASAKVRLIASHFLISTTQGLQELSDSEEEDATNPSDIKWIKGIRRHTKNKEKKLQKEKKRAERRIRKKQIISRKQNFMPIDLIYSPQDFAQKLFNIMNHKQTKFLHKLIYMALISRIIWRHKLIMLPFYGALQKYMDSRQKQAPKVLAYFAQSVHGLIPDDQLQPIVKHIIETFVNDKCSQFTMTIGLNTIREIYAKVPSIITEQAMTYLCTYYQYRNKNVTMAAKSVINLVRGINPYLLEKKYRGKNHNQPINSMLKQSVSNRINGAQLLGQDQNNLPIEMTKILTDEDFKKIRKLMRKRQEQEEWGQIIDQNAQNQQEVQFQGQDQIQHQEDQQGDQSQISSQNQADQNQDQSVLDWGDQQEFQQDQGQQLEQDQQEQQQQNDQEQDQQIEEQEQDLSQSQVIEFDQEQVSDQQEQIQSQMKKKKPTKIDKTKIIQKAQKNVQKDKRKKKSAKQRKQQELQSHSDDDQQQSEQENPHGFINLHQIAFYKKSKTQIKAQKRRNPQLKQKFKHKPKDKKGGSTNEQKNKSKPIMMLRDKKNKLKLRQKQVKIRIKNLKTQLGKVRSGKQAKKLKNKKIKKP